MTIYLDEGFLPIRVVVPLNLLFESIVGAI